MSLEQAFLDAIAVNPVDFTPRLIFMDWLDEQGDLRGELLRLLHTLTQEIDPPNRPVMEARLRGLLESGVQSVGPFWTNTIGMKFALITPGRFLMGSPATELERRDDETQHEVTLTKGFYLAVHPATQIQWHTVMGANPSAFQNENLPVEQVFWTDCQEFVKKLRDLDGKPYCLPTEAQWEFACRAGTTTPFYFGSELNGKQANCDGSKPYGTTENGLILTRTTEVGSYAANAWGLHDMHGNVSDWCQDYYGPYELIRGDLWQPVASEDPLQSTRYSKKGRVVRGGSWGSSARYCRAAYRIDYNPYFRYDSVGLRVCVRLD